MEKANKIVFKHSSKVSGVAFIITLSSGVAFIITLSSGVAFIITLSRALYFIDSNSTSSSFIKHSKNFHTEPTQSNAVIRD